MTYARVLLQLIKRVMARVRSSRALKPDGKRGTSSEGDGAAHGETEKTIFQLIDRLPLNWVCWCHILRKAEKPRTIYDHQP
ncbi:hypothetical protein EYF80_006119 [Liparis tanakae]|uniref:Uncharacterized protein n=1 Tax=Liparis tanakae TaxID=230148 RepID=A0A4Z2J0X7_9TELE|nr:hypothetical protein EYF80_006119 [Liparis tanakae]